VPPVEDENKIADSLAFDNRQAIVVVRRNETSPIRSTMTPIPDSRADDCPLCGYLPTNRDSVSGTRRVECVRCGTYDVDAAAEQHLRDPLFAPRRHLLSGVLRNAADAGKQLGVNAANVDSLVSAAQPPTSPLDSLDPVLEYAARNTPGFASRFTISKHDYPKFFLRSADEMLAVLEALERLEPILYPSDNSRWESRVTIEGWQHLEAMRASRSNSRQAFVAMSFNPALDVAWLEGIRPALRDCGYQPFRADHKEHNDRIDDVIMAELRRSGLVVADFTNHAGGVYFEAGYGMGRGTPVIWTIRADALSGIHFDTRQYNHIVWETPADLRAKLRARIMATLPVYPALSQ
jgi:hypothetical protein